YCLPGTPQPVCSARDPYPRRSVSSDPPANRARILSRESIVPKCFYTWGTSAVEPYAGFGNQLSRNRRGPPHGTLQRRRATMEHYVGLDVSLKQTAICVVDQTGSVIREGMVDSAPETIAEFVTSNAPSIVRIGLEAGPTSTWLWT